MASNSYKSDKQNRNKEDVDLPNSIGQYQRTNLHKNQGKGIGYGKVQKHTDEINSVNFHHTSTKGLESFGDHDTKPVNFITAEQELNMLSEEIVYLEKKLNSQPNRPVVISTDLEVNIMLNIIDTFDNNLPTLIEDKIGFLKTKVLKLKQVVYEYFQNMIVTPITSQIRLLEKKLDKIKNSHSYSKVYEIENTLASIKVHLKDSTNIRSLELLAHMLTKLTQQLRGLENVDDEEVILNAIKIIENVIKAIKQSFTDIQVHLLKNNHTEVDTDNLNLTPKLLQQNEVDNSEMDEAENVLKALEKEVEDLKKLLGESYSRAQIISVDIKIDDINNKIKQFEKDSSSFPEDFEERIEYLKEQILKLKEDVYKRFQELFVNPILIEITSLKTQLDKIKQSYVSNSIKHQIFEIEKGLQKIEMQLKHSNNPKSLEKLENLLNDLIKHLKKLQNEHIRESFGSAFPFIENVVGDIKHSFYIVHIHHFTGGENKRQTQFEYDMQVEKELNKLIAHMDNLKGLTFNGCNRSIIMYLDVEIHKIQSKVEQIERNISQPPDFLKVKLQFLNEQILEMKIYIGKHFEELVVNPTTFQIKSLETQLNQIKQSQPSKKLQREINEIENSLYGIKTQLQSSTEPKALEQLELSLIQIMDRLKSIEKQSSKGIFGKTILLLKGFVRDINNSFHRIMSNF